MIGFFGFIYLTINLINGKMYIGKCKYDKNNKWKHYLGSGTILKQAIKKYGKKNFVRIILEDCKTKKDLSDMEKFYIKEMNAQEDELFYNIKSGGEGEYDGQNIDLMKKVIDFTDKKIYNSLSEFCNAFNKESSFYYHQIKRDGTHNVKGHEVWYIDDLPYYKTQDELGIVHSKNLQNRKTGTSPNIKDGKLIVMPDKFIYDDCEDFLTVYGGTKQGLLQSLKRHHKYKGIDVWWYNDIENYIPAEVRIHNARKRTGQVPVNKIKIHVKEIDKTFASITEAGEQLGISFKQISQALKRKTKCHGFTFEYI